MSEFASTMIEEVIADVFKKGVESVVVSGGQKFGFHSKIVDGNPILDDCFVQSGYVKKSVWISEGADLENSSKTLGDVKTMKEILEKKGVTQKLQNVTERYRNGINRMGYLGVVVFHDQNEIVIFGGFATEKRFEYRPRVTDFIRLKFRDVDLLNTLTGMFYTNQCGITDGNKANSRIIKAIIECSIPNVVSVGQDIGLKFCERDLDKKELMEKEISPLILNNICISSEMVVGCKYTDSNWANPIN